MDKKFEGVFDKFKESIVVDKLLESMLSRLNTKTYYTVQKALNDIQDLYFSEKNIDSEKCLVLQFGSHFWYKHIGYKTVTYNPSILEKIVDNVLRCNESKYSIVLDQKLDALNDPVFLVYIGFEKQVLPLSNFKKEK